MFPNREQCEGKVRDNYAGEGYWKCERFFCNPGVKMIQHLHAMLAQFALAIRDSSTLFLIGDCDTFGARRGVRRALVQGVL